MVSETEDAAPLTPGDHKRFDLCAPEETLSNGGGVPATVFQEGTVRHPGHR